MFGHGVIVDMVGPYVVLVVDFIVSYLYRYFAEFKDKSLLKGAFSKYVNAEVVDEILRNPALVKLGGEKRVVSVLFTDIAHFTSISEGLCPESLIALLNEYFSVMAKVVMDVGGTVDKFEGDALMAFFGAPVEQGDHARRACLAGLRMRVAMDELNEKWRKNGEKLPCGEEKPFIDFRCGINSGEAIVGNMGSLDKFNYTAIGDSVNLASRLEGINKVYGTNLIISEYTYELVKEFFVVRELDKIRVVGKSEPTLIFELLGEKNVGVSDEAKMLLSEYNEGIGLYKERRFGEALEKFRKIVERFPYDGPSKLYVQRCEIFKDFPPKDDWDGVFVAQRK